MLHEISAKCPNKKCKGYATASVSYDVGNTEAPCDECGNQVGFHYEVEIDGEHLVDE